MGRYQGVSGMSEADARDYVLRCVTDVKLQRRRLQDLSDELARWRKRVNLAAEADRDDLKRAAEERAIELEVEERRRRREVEQLETDAARLLGDLRVHTQGGARVQYAAALADQLEAALEGDRI